MLYRYSQFTPQAAAQRIQKTLRTNYAVLQKLLSHLAALPHVSWNDVMPPLYALDDALFEFAVMSHMHSVDNTEALRNAYQTLLVLVNNYQNWLTQNAHLYAQIERIDTHTLSAVQRRQVTLLKDTFKLAGTALTGTQAAQFRRLRTQCAKVSMRFENNLLDATATWSMPTTAELLAGVPSDICIMMQNVGKDKSDGSNQQTYKLTIRPDIYSAIMRHADNRQLRATLHKAYHTRATPSSATPQFDNSKNIQAIVRNRHKQSQLLGFEHYAALSLQTKMADSITKVRDFLYQLADATRPQAQKEYKELCAFAQTHLSIDTLLPHDYAYVSNKLRQHKHTLDEEQLRQYFPLNAVLEGIYTIIRRLFAISIVPQQNDVWHEDVMLFAIQKENETIGYLYVDLFARDGKQSGAWMNDLQSRAFIEDTLTLPVAILVCNFPKTRQVLLYHHEVETLLHEFGHCLHHLLTTIDMPDIAGINGVEWDAVELPSQLLEQWAWHTQTVPLISKNAHTGAVMPQALLDNLISSRHFHSALALTRQIEFALLDLELHATQTCKQNTLVRIQKAIWNKVSVMPHADYEHTFHAFAHIFAGGYAAGYYSYLWAELLASNVYQLFAGDMLSQETGQKYHDALLSRGASKPTSELFYDLCGHEPDIQQFLSSRGILVPIKKRTIDNTTDHRLYNL